MQHSAWVGHLIHRTPIQPGGLTFGGGQVQHPTAGSSSGHLAHKTPIQLGGVTSSGGQLQHGGIAATDTAKMARIAAKIARKFILYSSQLN